MGFLSGFSTEIIIGIMALITTVAGYLFGGRRQRDKDMKRRLDTIKKQAKEREAIADETDDDLIDRISR